MQLALEIFGYAASAILVSSLMMSNLFRLRVLNLIGCVLFGAYGGLIQAWPVLVINGFCVILNAFYLLRFLRDIDYFDLSPANTVGPEFLEKFFLFHEKDIRRFAPDVTLESLRADDTRLLFRNMLPVGVFSFRKTGEVADISIDYVIAEYRDFKSGRYLFEFQRMYFKQLGIKQFRTRAVQRQTIRYLMKNGFYASSDDPELYVKDL